MVSYKKKCKNCEKRFVARRKDKVYCSSTCRICDWHRNKTKMYGSGSVKLFADDDEFLKSLLQPRYEDGKLMGFGHVINDTYFKFSRQQIKFLKSLKPHEWETMLGEYRKWREKYNNWSPSTFIEDVYGYPKIVINSNTGEVLK